jgi:hypothetical protein
MQPTASNLNTRRDILKTHHSIEICEGYYIETCTRSSTFLRFVPPKICISVAANSCELIFGFGNGIHGSPADDSLSSTYTGLIVAVSGYILIRHATHETQWICL